MFQSKILFLIYLILSAFCTLLIYAIRKNNADGEDNKGINDYRKCTIAMKGAFGMELDTPKIEFVKKAVKEFSNYETYNMDEDVQKYYLSFFEKLSADKIQPINEFCEKFTNGKDVQMEDNIRNTIPIAGDDFVDLPRPQRYIICVDYLNQTTLKQNLKEDILKKALYEHRQLSNYNLEEQAHGDTLKNKISYENNELFGHNQEREHTPLSYGYFYLNDIADHVTIDDTLLDPKQYCRKHSKKITEDQAESLEEDMLEVKLKFKPKVEKEAKPEVKSINCL